MKHPSRVLRLLLRVTRKPHKTPVLSRMFHILWGVLNHLVCGSTQMRRLTNGPGFDRAFLLLCSALDRRSRCCRCRLFWHVPPWLPTLLRTGDWASPLLTSAGLTAWSVLRRGVDLGDEVNEDIGRKITRPHRNIRSLQDAANRGPHCSHCAKPRRDQRRRYRWDAHASRRWTPDNTHPSDQRRDYLGDEFLVHDYLVHERWVLPPRSLPFPSSCPRIGRPFLSGDMAADSQLH